MRALFALAIVFFVGLPHTIFALPWKSSAKLARSDQINLLRTLHPNINNANELSQLLKRFSMVGPLKFIYAEFRNDHWFIEGEYAKEIENIVFQVPTMYLSKAVETVTSNFIGRVDSIQNRKFLKSRLQEKLRLFGYPFNSINILPSSSKVGITYTLNINEGVPCTINEIIYTLETPLKIEDVKKGDLCEIEKIESSIRKLQESLQDDFFAEARIEFGGLRIDKETGLAKLLIKGSLGERVLYRIIDSKAQFSLDDLFSDNNIRFDPNFVSPEAMVSEIKRAYQNNGYADAVVFDPKKNYLDNQTVVYSYEVKPGPVYKISNTVFNGLSVFSIEKASNLLGISSFWKANPVLNLDEVRIGIENLKSEYLSNGYWDIKIREPRITKDSQTGNAQLVIILDEGLPHVLDEFKIEGNQSIKFTPLVEKMKVLKNEPINKEAIFEIEDELRRIYIDKGFLYVNVDKEISRSIQRKHQAVRLKLKITEGARAKIGYIEIDGLNKTERKVIERELQFKTGDWYLPNKITDTRRRIINTGVFGAVQIQPVDRNDLVIESKVIDLKISVREKIPGQVSFGPGYQIGKGFQYVAESSYANIGGLGRRASIRTAFSQEKNQKAIDNRTLLGRKFGIGYLEPHIFSSDLDLRTTLSHKAIATSYWDIGYSGELALIQELPVADFGSPSELRYFYSIKLNREEGTPEQTRYILTEGDVMIGSFGIGYKLDTRNSQSWPTKGTLFESEIRFARYGLGGNVAYNRFHVEQSFYKGLSPNWVLLGTYSSTTISNIGRNGAEPGMSVLPASERLFAGGTDQVRGYVEPLGPFLLYEALQEDNGESSLATEKEVIGGTHRFIAKIALRYRIDESYGLFTFADLGNSYSSLNEQEKFESRFNTTDVDTSAGRFKPSVEENFVYSLNNVLTNPSLLIEKNYLSYGIGMNLLTPFGTASFYYALPWKQPLSPRCSRDSKACLDRRKTGDTYLFRGEIGLNIGKRF